MRTLQRERTLVKSLVDLALTTEQAIELLTHPVHATSQQSGSARGSARAFAVRAQTGEAEGKKTFSLPPKFAEYLEGLVDASDRLEGGGVVLYWNDLAADARYAKSNPSLQAVRIVFSQVTCTSDLECDNSQLLHVHSMSLFSPMFRIRQNLINVIFVLDLSQIRSLSLLSSLSDHFVARGFPARWGFVPEAEGDSESMNAFSRLIVHPLPGLQIARVVYYINQKYGRDQMIAFIQGVCIS